MSEHKIIDPEVKTKWVEALRSGKFLQGRGALRVVTTPVRHCCLGVLCEVLNQRLDEPPAHVDVDHSITPLGEHKYLPLFIAERVFGPGAPTEGPSVIIGDRKEECLAYLNDEGFTFAQIATAIEEQL